MKESLCPAISVSVPRSRAIFGNGNMAPLLEPLFLSEDIDVECHSAFNINRAIILGPVVHSQIARFRPLSHIYTLHDVSSSTNPVYLRHQIMERVTWRSSK